LKKNQSALFISASSVNGTFGGFGVGAYAAASSFLDHLSYYQRNEDSLRSYCLAWSLWDEVGMGRNRQMKDLVRSRGYLTIGVKRGLNALLAGLSQDFPHLLVGLDGSNKRMRRLIESDDYRAEELCAYITSATASLPVAKLKELEVRDRFHARSACDFSQIAQMPLRPDKTIDRAALRNGARAAPQSRTAYAPPQTETEQTIAAIWREVLKADRVGLHDNFFEIGGHSLAITQARLKIQAAFSRDVSIVEMFKYPTISSLALLLTQQSVEAPSFQRSYKRLTKRAARPAHKEPAL
jgi:acyl carrier protein